MLSETPDRSHDEERPAGQKAKRDDQPEYVGAPTEYADEAEVPEAVGLITKALAGGFLAWSTVAIVLAVAGALCAVCVVLYFVAGLVLR